MATKKAKTTMKKAIKELEKEVVLKEEKLSEDELILGVQPQKSVVREFDYENENAKYKVTNLLFEETTPTIVTGDVIETFIGSRNKEARYALKKGEKEVITYEHFTNKPMYKIEVI